MSQPKRLVHPSSLGIYLTALVLVLADLPSVSGQEPLVVFLVRHAEKVDAGKDPELSGEGKVRARQLADLLRGARIKHIHSSDFIRTRDSAKPTAERLKQRVNLYDPRDLAALIRRLKTSGGRHLVVGHSTTTPTAVSLLGGEPGTPINEKGEYDRLYIVTVATNGEVSTVLLRFGKPFQR